MFNADLNVNLIDCSSTDTQSAQGWFVMENCYVYGQSAFLDNVIVGLRPYGEIILKNNRIENIYQNGGIV